MRRSCIIKPGMGIVTIAGAKATPSRRYQFVRTVGGRLVHSATLIVNWHVTPACKWLPHFLKFSAYAYYGRLI